MPLNPVERRLALLCGEWMDFRADVSRRLLVWQVPENAMRLVQCFFEVQKLDLEYSSRDLFVVLKPPFEHSIQYARELKVSLRGQYDASRDDLASEGLPADWDFEPGQVPDSPGGVVAALRSFGSKYHRTIGHLAVVLQPPAVSDPVAFSAWVLRALETDPPERLRFVVVDSLEHPRYASLAPDRDPRIAVRQPPVDGLATAQETFAQEAVAGPAGVFRNLLMGVASLVEKGSADQVKVKAADAVAFARRHGWADQEVVLGMMLAGAYLKESRHQDAIGVYRWARAAAEKALGAEHPAGQKLVLQTWFGEAGAALAAGNPLEAARCYDEAAVVAQRDRNLILSIEAFRMSAFCHARAGNADLAVDRARLAMKIGERLKPEVRGQTTMPFAAFDLLRACDPGRVTLLEHVKARMEARLADARRAAEERAAAAGPALDAQCAQEIEARLAAETGQARAEAERELGAVVAEGNSAFRDEFMRARDLLGPAWPLEGLPSRPAVAAGSGAAAQAAVR